MISSSPALADHDDGFYEIPAHANWDHGTLSVLIVPPVHGQIFNGDTGVLNNGDAGELTPFNTYLKAIEVAVAEWDRAINMLGADWLKAYYEPSVYVLGRDPVPPEVVASPDILVVTDGEEGPSLGTAIWGKTGYVHTPCVVRLSSSFLLSFTYADMYNVTAQEYGHCLGLGHVGSQGGVDPTSEQKHPEHDVMNGYYADSIGSAGTHLHCVSNLDVKALEHVFDYELAYSAVLNLGVEGITYMPVEAYGDTCIPPPPNWREVTPPTALPGAPRMDSVIESPRDDARVRASKLGRVKGTARIEASPGSVSWDIEVALAAVDPDGSCRWWDGDSSSFILRDCYSPKWEVARKTYNSDKWSWRPPNDLPAGSYRIISRVISEYGNEPVEDGNTTELRVIEPRRP